MKVLEWERVGVKYQLEKRILASRFRAKKLSQGDPLGRPLGSSW